MDIKAKIDEIVSKIKSDPALMDEFKKEPVKAAEKLTGADLPDDVINPVIEGVKAKLSAEGIKDKLGSLGSLFGGNK